MAMTAQSDGEISAEGSRHRPGAAELWRAWLWALAGAAGADRSALKTAHVRLWLSDHELSAWTARRTRCRALDVELGANGNEIDWTQVRQALARKRVAGRPIVLRLAADQVLAKTMRFPAAVADVIAPVLRNQMQRLTPWPDNEVLFGYDILPKTDAGDHINVNVVAAHRPAIDSLRAAAAQAGLNVVRIDHANAAQAADAIALYDAGRDNRRRTAQRFGRLLVALLIIGLGIGTVGLFEAARSYQSKARLQEQISFAQLRIADHARQRNRHAATSDTYQSLLGRKSAKAPAVWVMNELTKAMPDHSWLSAFSIADGRLAIAGSSIDAAELLATLERTAAFTDVRFTAATTRDRESNRERFAIAATIVSAGWDGGGPR